MIKFLNDQQIKDCISLLIASGGVWLSYYLCRAGMLKTKLPVETKRGLIVLLRNLHVAALITYGFILFSSELRSLAISVAAVGAAIIIVSKEAIMNIMGGVARTAGGWSIGDTIEMPGMKGEIMDLSAFQTTLLECGDDNLVTGNIVTIPNSLFMTSIVKKVSYFNGYCFKTVILELDKNTNPVEAKMALENAAKSTCEPFLLSATTSIQDHFKAASLPTPNTDIVSGIKQSGSSMAVFARFPCPSNKSHAIGQEILKLYFVEIFSKEVSKQGGATNESQPNQIHKGSAMTAAKTP